MSQLMSPEDRLPLLRHPPGSEWLESLIATGLRYPVPWHGHPTRWDWGMTAYTLGIAQLKTARVAEVAASLTPDQRLALWHDNSDASKALRKALR